MESNDNSNTKSAEDEHLSEPSTADTSNLPPGEHDSNLPPGGGKSSSLPDGAPSVGRDPNQKSGEPEEESDITGSDEENEFDGNESDIEDNYDELVTFPSQRIRRHSNPDLPETVTVLKTDAGGTLYLVGTAHFSQQSQNDVETVIDRIQPDIVVVELCSSRVNILQLDESTLLDEARNINFSKVRDAIKQGGLIHGVMHILLLNMSAHLTKQLGMAPGGEFRAAFREARKIPGCLLHLGDRPIQVTLKRAFASLSWWQRLRLAWYMITSKDPISAEEVEKCKQKDLLEEMLREMTGEFPHISRVFVEERDVYLAHSLRHAVRPIPPLTPDGEWVPSTVVGVVGIGHVAGIVKNWDSVTSADVAEIMQIPAGSALGSVVRWGLRGAVVGVLSWAVYCVFNRMWDFVTS